MARLLISAAHTLENPGAIYQDLREADITRKLLQLCLPYLDQSKITYQAVPLDLPLLQRIDWINATGYSEEQGDIFIELHVNDGGKRGVEGWFRGSGGPTNKSQKLAESLVSFICKTSNYTNQGAKSEYEHELTSLLILNSTNSTGTAIEILYIDNPQDIAIIKDDAKMNDLAKVLADGIVNYINVDVNVQPAAQTAIQPTTTPTASDPSMVMPMTPAPYIPTNNSLFSANKPSFPQTPAATAQPTPSFGGSNFGGGGFGGGSSFGGGSNFGVPSGGSKTTLMDRDQRKEMIKKTYQRILGKEPNQSDLNYYLNLGVNEEDLAKKLLEGDDFKNMVKDATEAKELRNNTQRSETQIALLKSNLNDARSMQVVLQRLLEQKNIMINRFYQELVANKIVQEGQHIDARKAHQQAQSAVYKKPRKSLKHKFRDRVIKLVGG